MFKNYFLFNNKENAIFKTTTFVVILSFAISSFALVSKNATTLKSISTSSPALYKNSPSQLLSNAMFISSASMCFSTYIYIPILHVKNKGDDLASNLAKKLSIRYQPKRHFASKNYKAQAPIQNNINLIQNT